MLGIGVSLRALRSSVSSGAIAAFSPADLFASGEEGAWYEPSTTTCFTDTGGTVAATYGDGVAHLQDLSGNGNHATQVTAGARPILARVPEGGRRNLLERTEEFDNGYWTKLGLLAFGSGSVANTTATTDPLGGNTAEFIVPNTSNTTHAALKNPVGLSLIQYTISVYAKAGGYNWFLLANNQDGGMYVNLSDGSIGTVSAGFSNPTVTPVGNGWYRCSVTYTRSGASRGIGIYVANGDGVASFAGDGTSGIYIWGAQLETGSTATDYQKVVDEYDVTEAGVTSLEYLSFDGVDDSLEMSSAVPVTNNWFSCWGGNFDAYANYYGAWRWLKEGANPSSIDTNRLEEYTRLTRDRVIYSRVDPAGSSYNSVSAYPVAGTDMVVFANRSVEEVTLGEIYPGSSRQLLTPLDLPYSTTGSATMSLARAYSGDFAPMTLYGIVFVWGDVSSIERGKANEYMAAKSGVTL